MVLLEGIALGWLLIVIGAFLLLVEVHSPGFFATVPATVMILLGILLLLGVPIIPITLMGHMGIMGNMGCTESTRKEFQI